MVLAKVLGLSLESSWQPLRGPKQGSDMIRLGFQKDHSSCKEEQMEGASPRLPHALILLFPPTGSQATVSRAAPSSSGKFRSSLHRDLHQNLPLGLYLWAQGMLEYLACLS